MLACHGMAIPAPWLLLILVVLIGWVLSAILILPNLYFIFFKSSGRIFTIAHTGIVGLYVGLTLWLYWIATQKHTADESYVVVQWIMGSLALVVPAMVSGHFAYLKYWRRQLRPEEIHETWLSGLFRGPVKPVKPVKPAPVPTLDEETQTLLAAATKLEIAGRIHEALAAYQNIAQKYPNTTAGSDAQKSYHSLKTQIGETS